MVARVLDGEVNPAFGWHEGLEKRIISHTLPCAQRVTFQLLKPSQAPCVVISAGRVILQVVNIPQSVCTNDTIDLRFG